MFQITRTTRILKDQERELKDKQETALWDIRAQRYGHTGWADQVIYAYDQQARLSAIKKVIDDLDCGRSLALDFGTCSGDFANLLSQGFERVIAFDISESVIKVARNRYHKGENIEFVSGEDIKQLAIGDNTLDIILSVTVLDHILDNVKFGQILSRFHALLKNKGFVVALEYALGFEKPSNSYQRFMQLKEWTSVFNSMGFYLHKCYGFYHPVEVPSGSYLEYVKSLGIVRAKIFRLLTRNRAIHLVGKHLSELASKSLQGKQDFFWEVTARQSPLKIMIFKKIEHAMA